jgi:hypothetical protein
MSPRHDAKSLATRLDQLELQNRHLRFATGVVITLAAGLGVIGFRSRVPTVVQAERFELVTPTGQRRAVLTADSSAFSVVLYGPRGQPMSGFALSAAVPRLVVLSSAGHVLASLGGPTTYPARP